MPPASARRSPSSRSPIRAPASGACRSSSATRACSSARWRPPARVSPIRRIGAPAEAHGHGRDDRRPRRRRHRHGDATAGARSIPELRRRRRALDQGGRTLRARGRDRRHGVGAAQQGGDARGRVRLRGADRDPGRADAQQAGDGDGGRPHAPHAVHEPHGAARGVRLPAHRPRARAARRWPTPRCATWGSRSRASPSPD